MPVKFEMDMSQTPEGGEGVIVARWSYYCGGCKTKRTAVIFGSGHVFDLTEGQESVVENVVVEGGAFKNLYFIPEAGIERIRDTQTGMQAIKASISQAHASQFHGGAGVNLKGRN